MQKEAEKYWQTMNRKILLRADMIPNLIETLRRFSKDFDVPIAEMVRLRSQSWAVQDASVVKIQTELETSSALHQIWNISEKNPQLNGDVNFLALKKGMTDLGQNIDKMTDEYNSKIRHFNKKVGPFSILMRLKKMPVFEFEA